MRLKQALAAVAWVAWVAWAVLVSLVAAPRPAHAQEELVENPVYASWAAHKSGTRVVSEMATSMGPMTMTMEMTQTLLELDADKAVVEIVTQANVPGVPGAGGQGNKQKQTIKAKVPKEEAEKGKLPPGMTAEMKKVDAESIEIAGTKYECEVFEFKGKNEQGEQTGKVWNCNQIPGRLAKMTSKGQAAGQEMSMTLTVKSVETK